MDTMTSLDAPSGARADTPVGAYRLLSPPRTTAVVAGLLVVTAAAWVYTVDQASSMSDMVMGLGQVGGRMSMGMAVSTFFAMWAVMMVAMMAPAVAPVALAHQALARRRGDGLPSTAGFVAGFLALWAVVGVVALGAFLAFHDIPADAARSRWLPTLAGATLAVAGAYQFSGWKRRTRACCCAPVKSVTDEDAGPGAWRAVAAGAKHGVRCLGCCWLLMVVLLVVGLMNLAWMVALSVVFVVEKHWSAPNIARVVGVALIVVGLAVVVRPSLMHAVSGTGDRPPPMSNMSNMKM